MVLELTRAGEVCAQDATLDSLLRDTLGLDSSHPIFIPARTYERKGTKVTIHLMEGYCFVASGLPDVKYLALEHDCPYVRKVLASIGPGGMPVLQVISNTKIEEMKSRLQEIISTEVEAGMRVHITQGTYAKLEGDVLDLEGEEAHVHIKMRSFQVIKSIPRAFLEPAGEKTD